MSKDLKSYDFLSFTKKYEFGNKPNINFEKKFNKIKFNRYKAEDILKDEIDINVRDSYGDTYLISLCKNPQILSLVENIKYLLDKGADPNIRDKRGLTPLMIISKQKILNSEEIINLLLNNKANINEKSYDGYTALMYAVKYSKKYNNYDIVKLLLEKGANVNDIDRLEFSVLMTAVKYCCRDLCDIDTIKILIKYGADINYINSKKESALSCLLLNYNKEIMEILKENNFNERNLIEYIVYDKINDKEKREEILKFF